MSAAGRVWAVAVGKQSATKTKTTGGSPQTIGGKVGGSFGESKMRQQNPYGFSGAGASATPTSVERRPLLESQLVPALLKPMAARTIVNRQCNPGGKRCSRDRSSR